ncbi:MAG: stage III sporulation protein AF [Firmicutes bacterium]|jgi:stage III sporulation protein AF|nr:stage III sporulation protein AF [Bacillota bacterium]
MLSTAGVLIRYIVILIFLAALLEMLLPQGVFRQYLRVFIGILLIFTLLNPIQKIMRIAPYWEMPVIEGMENNQDLNAILERGERLYRDNMVQVPQEYRQRIYQLLEAELARQFSQQLVQLEIGMEENPHNRDFGILTDIAVVTRDLQPAEISATEEKVEKVKISVDVMGKKGSLFAAEETEEPPGGAGGGPQDRPAPGDLRHTRAEEIRRYLSAYCNLPVDKVYVTILP